MAAVITISRRWGGIAALLLLTLPLTKQAQAQAVVPVRHTDLPIGCEVETAAPYSNWKTHRGKPEECLAVVRYGDQTCNALVVRCDGFLALPETAWQAQIDRQKLEVLVTKAEGESEVGPFPINAPVRRKTSRADYRLVKLNDHHVRSLPLLASHQLTKDTPLVVLWATVAKDSKKLVIEKRKAKFEELIEPRRGFHATLSYEGEAPKSVPSGAVVVDEASGAAVGMIADGSQPTQLSTWRFWYDIVNEVGLAPDRDAAMGKAPGSESHMVPVKGGPVRLFDTQKLRMGKTSTFITDFGTDIVCTADFYCDINPVTYGEWLNWRESLRINKPPLPITWSSVLNPPHNNLLIPVGGLRAQDMENYADAQGKRMITEVEFNRAAYTKDMTWLDRIDQSVEEVGALIKPMLSQYILDLGWRLYEAKRLARLQKRAATELNIDVSDLTAQLRVNMNGVAQQTLAQGIVQENTQVIPGHVNSVQFVPGDKSDAGVRHIHLNIPEACQAYNLGLVTAPKTRASYWDPFLAQVSMVTSENGKKKESIGPVISMRSDPLINIALFQGQFGNGFLWSAGAFGTIEAFERAAAMFMGQQYLEQFERVRAMLRESNPEDLDPIRISGGFTMRTAGKTVLGFRCVR